MENVSHPAPYGGLLLDLHGRYHSGEFIGPDPELHKAFGSEQSFNIGQTLSEGCVVLGQAPKAIADAAKATAFKLAATKAGTSIKDSI